jgi:hypothetical protein
MNLDYRHNDPIGTKPGWKESGDLMALPRRVAFTLNANGTIGPGNRCEK